MLEIINKYKKRKLTLFHHKHKLIEQSELAPVALGRFHSWSNVPLHFYTAGLDQASECHLENYKRLLLLL